MHRLLACWLILAATPGWAQENPEGDPLPRWQTLDQPQVVEAPELERVQLMVRDTPPPPHQALEVGLVVLDRQTRAWDSRVVVSRPRKMLWGLHGGLSALVASTAGRRRSHPAREGLWTKD